MWVQQVSLSLFEWSFTIMSDDINKQRNNQSMFTLTTVCPTASTSCYSCNSGNEEWQNPDCPADGSLDSETVKSVQCDGSCMAKQNKWDPGSKTITV